MNIPLEQIPWLQPEVFPRKPEGEDYGYYQKRKMYPCSKAELVLACGPKASTELDAVWHPGVDRLVPPCEVPELVGTLRERARNELSKGFKVALGMMCVFGLMLITAKSQRADVFLSFLAFGLFPVLCNAVGLLRLKRNLRETSEPISPGARFGYWLSQHRPVFTWTLCVLIVVLGLLTMILGQIYGLRSVVLSKDPAHAGEFWRLFTGPLLHADPMHLLMNGIALLWLGTLVEVLAGRGPLVWVLIFSILIGSLFSCWLGPDQDSIGISGGILGLLGYILILGIRYKKFFPPGFIGSFVTTLGAVAVIGLLASDYIDNAAHLGGCLAGAVAGAAFTTGKDFQVPLAVSPVWKWSAHLGLGLLCVAGLATGLLMVGII